MCRVLVTVMVKAMLVPFCIFSYSFISSRKESELVESEVKPNENE